MSLGTMEQRTEGMKRQAHELIEQAYNRGYNAGYEEGKGQAWSEEVKRYEIEPDKKNEYIEQGRNEAWEAMRTIVGLGEPLEICGVAGFRGFVCGVSASEAIKKLRAYEEQKKREENEIKVGDEVADLHGSIGIVLHTSDRNLVVMAKNGYSSCLPKLGWTKTGRTFPEIAEVLKKMQEGE